MATKVSMVIAAVNGLPLALRRGGCSAATRGEHATPCPALIGRAARRRGRTLAMTAACLASYLCNVLPVILHDDVGRWVGDRYFVGRL